MSIFTLNVLDWFFTAGLSSQATGEPITLGSVRAGDRLTTPKGAELSLKAGYDYFSGTFHQGIYLRNRGNQREFLARNLQDTNESDLRAIAPIQLRGGEENPAANTVLFSFWPYLLLASLGLSFIEWFVNPRVTYLGLWSKRRGLKQRS